MSSRPSPLIQRQTISYRTLPKIFYHCKLVSGFPRSTTHTSRISPHLRSVSSSSMSPRLRSHESYNTFVVPLDTSTFLRPTPTILYPVSLSPQPGTLGTFLNPKMRRTLRFGVLRNSPFTVLKESIP